MLWGWNRRNGPKRCYCRREFDYWHLAFLLYDQNCKQLNLKSWYLVYGEHLGIRLLIKDRVSENRLKRHNTKYWNLISGKPLGLRFLIEVRFHGYCVFNWYYRPLQTHNLESRNLVYGKLLQHRFLIKKSDNVEIGLLFGIDDNVKQHNVEFLRLCLFIKKIYFPKIVFLFGIIDNFQRHYLI